MTELPYAIREAMVEVCRTAFHYKDGLRSLFVGCGVSAELWDRHKELSKAPITRRVLEHLDKRGDVGQAIQQKILRELCALRAPAHDAPDRDAAVAALRQLKELAHDHLKEAEAERARRETRR